jgi:hypothetical protein
VHWSVSEVASYCSANPGPSLTALPSIVALPIGRSSMCSDGFDIFTVTVRSSTASSVRPSSRVSPA